jgi:hypothetical protein
MQAIKLITQRDMFLYQTQVKLLHQEKAAIFSIVF